MTTQSTLSSLASKFGTALSILTLSAVVTPAAFAGEAFVTNTHRNSYGYSETDLNIESNSFTDGSRQFTSVADKIFIDGDINLGAQDGFDGPTLQSQGGPSALTTPSVAPFGLNVGFDKFTVHTASSVEEGEEVFGSETFVDGTIFTREDFDETSHTTAAGIR